MFFHTHAYFSQRVDKQLDALKVVGSMLPDIAVTGIVSWENMHKRQGVLEFFAYVKKSAPEFISLAQGIAYHCALDRTSHLEYKNSHPGYAYVNITPELFKLLKKTIDVSDLRARQSGHNIIEAGVNYHLLREKPELITLVNNSLLETDMPKLGKLLSDCYGKGEKEAVVAVNNFSMFITDYDLRGIDEWVRFFVDMNKYYLKIDTDEVYVKKTLELAFEITKNNWKEYLETSIASFDGEVKDSN